MNKVPNALPIGIKAKPENGWLPIGKFERYIFVHYEYKIVLHHYIESKNNYCDWTIEKYLEKINECSGFGLEKCKLIAIDQLEQILETSYKTKWEK